MRIAYANAYFKTNHSGGGHVHMGQFVSNVVASGHEVWSWPSNEHPLVRQFPSNLPGFVRKMRQMDVLYVRLERNPPRICRWTLPPHRILYKLPVVVWEFNTIPEEGRTRNQPQDEISEAIHYLQHYGRGCDLAVCVSPAAADYVQDKLGIRRTLVVPNGSDPDLFDPDIQPVERMSPFLGKFNVAWIGSADIEYHDFNMLRQAAQLLWDRGDGDQIVFHIIGPGLNSVMGDMPPNVYYWGAENYQRVPHWLAAMDVGLYITVGGTSAYGAPLKIFDYMASGLAVASTTHPFVSQLFEELGQTDLIVPLGSPETLADVLIGLKRDRERLKALGQASRNLVVNHYNWRQAVRDTMSEIESIFRDTRS